jgi:hypothetical protein
MMISLKAFMIINKKINNIKIKDKKQCIYKCTLFFTYIRIQSMSRNLKKTFKVCPETFKVCPEILYDCYIKQYTDLKKTFKVCPETFKVCPETFKVCPEI